MPRRADAGCFGKEYAVDSDDDEEEKNEDHHQRGIAVADRGSEDGDEMGIEPSTRGRGEEGVLPARTVHRGRPILIFQ